MPYRHIIHAVDRVPMHHNIILPASLILEKINDRGSLYFHLKRDQHKLRTNLKQQRWQLPQMRSAYTHEPYFNAS